MTPATAIAMLDAQMRVHGQTATLQLAGTTTPVTFQLVSVLAFVRQYKPDELAGALQQGDRLAIIRNTELAAYRAPRKNDRLVLGSETCTVQSVETRRVADTVISHWMTIRG